MIFVFDWGHQTIKEVGPLSIRDYPNGLDADMVWLAIRKTWFRAFFIPTIPTKREEGIVLESGDFFPLAESEFEKWKPLAELNQLLVDGKISEDEYAHRRNQMKA
jgi:hypothetical protein